MSARNSSIPIELYTMISRWSIGERKVSDSCAALLAGLFAYAALSKLFNYEQSQKEMLNQVFPNEIALTLTWLIPTLELLLTVLLLRTANRKLSFSFSLVLLSIFSIYIGVSMTGVFGRIPCSCGGLLGQMSYGVHLVFNVFFILISWLGLLTSQQTINGKIPEDQTKKKEEQEQKA